MKITIAWQDCRDADYMNNHDCPLARALKREGIRFQSVGGSHIAFDDSPYISFSDSSHDGGWTSSVQRECALKQQDFILDIPGLEEKI